MTTYLGKSRSFGLPRVPFVNCGQFMYLVISLLVLRAGCGIWLYQILIIVYLFTFHVMQSFTSLNVCGSVTYISVASEFVISWRPFDVLMLYLRYWFSVTHKLNWNNICGPVTYILWSSDFTLCLEDFLMDKCHNCNIGSMWCKELPDKMLWVSDLDFMVQYFCLISWRLLDGLMLYWRYWFSVTQTLTI